MEEIKISVITVCYNAVDTIEKTMQSVLGQTFRNIEYIIIDGGSTDGTVEIIHRYADLLAYWVSEPDGGIYDAMNKGIERATGEWINFMNAGDYFSSVDVIEKIFRQDLYGGVDVVYGNSTSLKVDSAILNIAGDNVSVLGQHPIYRHGASFVRRVIHCSFMFNLEKKKDLGYALDYEVIYSLYKAQKVFKKVDVDIMSYQEEGISNHPLLSRYYIYKITSGSHFSLKGYFSMLVGMLFIVMNKLKLFVYVKNFIKGYVLK